MKNFAHLLLISLFLIGTGAYAQTLKDSEYKKDKTPQGFIENKGQITDQNFKPNASVKYLLNMPGLNVQLKANSFSYDAYVIEKQDVPKQKQSVLTDFAQSEGITYRFHRIDIEFIGANTSPKIIAEEPGSDYMNYFTTATSEGGATYVHHYGRITYQNLYPGIDLVFYSRPGTSKPVEYNFIVSPGVDPSLIQWKYKGSSNVKLLEGMIRIKTAHGMLNESIPFTFEKESGNSVAVNYKMTEKGIYSFNAGNYNKNSTLIIDPLPDIKWATYFGGSSTDQAYALKVDPSGNVLVTGYTQSTAGIATTGAYQTTFAGSNDIILTLFNSSGTRIWATYYGGSGFENGNAYGGNLYDNGGGLAIDGGGNVYITGFTTSTSQIATSGAFQATSGGSYDAFLAKFSTTGALIWGTFLGGSGIDMGYAVAVDASGFVYFTGRTESTSGIASTGAYQTSSGGSVDAFVAKFSSTGARVWSSYYGGSGEDMGKDITTDINGNVFVTGYAASTTAIATAGANQTTNGGGSDAFIAKFTTSGSVLWGTYFGGPSADYGQGSSTDGSGNIYITVDEEQRLLGLVSTSDVVGIMQESHSLEDKTARDAMSAEPPSIDEFATAEEAIEVLRNALIRHLPVTREGRLVGLITASDLIRHMLKQHPAPEVA